MLSQCRRAGCPYGTASASNGFGSSFSISTIAMRFRSI
jgi:hypothetical protein